VKTDAQRHELGVLAKLIILIGISLIIAGVVWHGVTFESLQRFWHDLAERPSAPMAFRFILQPLMATIAATAHGLKDARTGRSPYFWTLLRNPQERAELLREGLNATARIILLGIAMDVIYQVIFLKMFYPVEALIVALLLAFVPYVVVRGLVTRIARRWRGDAFPRQTRF
jgi:hypothetical protein